MYDEQNNPMNNPSNTPQNNAPQNEPYHWNTPAPENGAYHTAGNGQRETFPTQSTGNTAPNAQNTAGAAQQTSAGAPFQQSAAAQPQQGAANSSAPFHAQQGTPIYDRPHKRFGSGFHTGQHNGNGPQKSGGKGKWVALLIVCAIGGGLVGGVFGSGVGTSLFRPSTSVQISNRTVNEVKEVKVDGKTEMSNAENYAANVNSVVSINVGTETNFFGQTVEQASSGSGFILTSDGYILTNYHVVDGASTIKVTTYSGDTLDATYIGGDEDYDIAVIKIDATGLSPVTIGDSDKVNVGDSVIAIGNPLGELTFSLSSGSVSSANRAITVDNVPFNMIQVDCAINPGNSGGPLLNSYGEVIGIVSAKYSSYADTTVEGLGFAIPINDVYAMVQDIMENGYVTDKAYLGVYGTSVTQQLQMQYNLPVSSGFYVFSVESGGTAAKSGLQAGDIIVKLDDTEITSLTDLVSAKKAYRAGDTAKMVVNRGGQEVTLDFTFDSQPQEDATTTATTGNSSQNGGNYGNDYYYNYNPFSSFDQIA